MNMKDLKVLIWDTVYTVKFIDEYISSDKKGVVFSSSIDTKTNTILISTKELKNKEDVLYELQTTLFSVFLGEKKTDDKVEMIKAYRYIAEFVSRFAKED